MGLLGDIGRSRLGENAQGLIGDLQKQRALGLAEAKDQREAELFEIERPARVAKAEAEYATANMETIEARNRAKFLGGSVDYRTTKAYQSMPEVMRKEFDTDMINVGVGKDGKVQRGLYLQFINDAATKPELYQKYDQAKSQDMTRRLGELNQAIVEEEAKNVPENKKLAGYLQIKDRLLTDINAHNEGMDVKANQEADWETVPNGMKAILSSHPDVAKLLGGNIGNATQWAQLPPEKRGRVHEVWSAIQDAQTKAKGVSKDSDRFKLMKVFRNDPENIKRWKAEKTSNKDKTAEAARWYRDISSDPDAFAEALATIMGGGDAVGGKQTWVRENGKLVKQK